MRLRDQPFANVMIVIGRAVIDLRMRDGVGVVEPGNIGRARDTGKSSAISLLAFGRHGVHWVRYVFWLCRPLLLGLFPSSKSIIARLHRDVLNARDLAQQRRGYYEDSTWAGWTTGNGGNEGSAGRMERRKKSFFRQRSDFLLYEIVPSVSTIMGGAPIKSNRLGMRDREYAKIKPPNTYRIVLVRRFPRQGIGSKGRRDVRESGGRPA